MKDHVHSVPTGAKSGEPRESFELHWFPRIMCTAPCNRNDKQVLPTTVCTTGAAVSNANNNANNNHHNGISAIDNGDAAAVSSIPMQITFNSHQASSKNVANDSNTSTSVVVPVSATPAKEDDNNEGSISKSTNGNNTWGIFSSMVGRLTTSPTSEPTRTTAGGALDRNKEQNSPESQTNTSTSSKSKSSSGNSSDNESGPPQLPTLIPPSSVLSRTPWKVMKNTSLLDNNVHHDDDEEQQHNNNSTIEQDANDFSKSSSNHRAIAIMRRSEPKILFQDEYDEDHSNMGDQNPNNVSVEVTLPDDEDFLDLIGVECQFEEKETSDTIKWNKKPYILGLGACLLVLLAIIIGVTTTKKGSSSEKATVQGGGGGAAAENSKVPTVSPTLEETYLPTSPVPSSLVPTPVPVPFEETFFPSTREALNDPDSPQSRAYDWVSNHPNKTEMEDWRKTQLFALASVYFALNGDNWQEEAKEDWLEYDTPECDYWFPTVYNGRFDVKGDEIDPYNSVESCDSHGSLQSLILTRLDLASAPIMASIPPEIALMISLKVLVLPSNNVSDALMNLIPNELYDMEQLQVLNFKKNNFVGSIPEEFGKLRSLTELDLSENTLSGTIPTQLGLMTNLLDLYLFGNFLSGPLPTEIGELTSLMFLELDGCSLSGPIPTNIGRLANIQKINLHYNNLTGTLPSELGLLTAPIELSLTGNMFTGELPSELGLMTSMQYLHLFSMNLTGTIPSEMGAMTSMLDIGLDSNGFSGWIPSEIGLMRHLEWLFLFGNSLTGSVPSELGQLTALTHLVLDTNILNGQIPSELGLLTLLETLVLHNNDLSGTIPSELGLLTAMTELALNWNSLSGTIPGELASISSLEWLRLHDLPGLVGTIPALLASLRNLTYINLNGSNGLSGEVPSDLCGRIDFDCGFTLCGCDCPCS